MKLASVAIRNFRAIEEMELQLHPQLTVLHGANAHGKTSVLRAIAVGLGAIAKRLPWVSGVDFRKADPRRGAGPAEVVVHTTCGGTWGRRSAGGQRGTLFSPGLRWINERMDRIVAADRNGGVREDLPIVALYDTDRVVLDVPLRRRNFAQEFPRYHALEGALAARANFRELFPWFYYHENEELRGQKERRDFGYEVQELRAARAAIQNVLPDVSGPQVRVRPLRFEVSLKIGDVVETLDLKRLSGGYRAVLALVMDLARRMAQGNPHLEDPLRSEAVVLIDEVDLHLHPGWQQRILPDLTRTFPNAQFIVTTHSPHVLTTVKPDQVVTLSRENGRVVAGAPGWGTYGSEAGDVLATVMGVAQRPRNEFSKMLDRYRELVEDDRGETEEGLALREMLDGWNRHDPDLVRADVAIRRRKTLRRMGRVG